MSASIFSYVIIFCLVVGETYCLEVKVIVPPTTTERKSALLECRFDLGGRTFGSVAWGKDGKMFYSVTRRRVPPVEWVNLPGINVDVKKSNKTHVFVDHLSRASSGTYSCTVQTSGGGIQAARDRANMTVVERDPIPLLIGTRKGMFLVNTKNYSAATKFTDAPPVLSVGYHLKKEKIYYGQTGGNIINLDYNHEGESPFGGALILSEEGLVTSIAVDWIHNVLYFTDDYLDTVGSVNLASEDRNTLLESSDGVKNPESIVVDPFQEYLFWGDNDESDKKIVASGLDGRKNKEVIVSKNIKRAILTLDLERRRLYYISNEGLSSCKYDGSRTKLHLQHPVLDSNVNSLSYFDDYIFWSRYDTGKSSSGLFFTALVNTELPVNELPIKSILDVKVLHPDLQKGSLSYSCEMLECSHECMPDKGGSAQCTCPAGFSLTAGNSECKNDNEAEEKYKNCEKSVSTVNSKPVCKGDLIFEDRFDQSEIDLKKWQHTVQISSDYESEFAVFVKDQSNIFVDNGNLNIKPTLISDRDVSNGNISLLGCTSPLDHLCSKQAFSYNILPPVKSGLLNTRQTFSFRYGVITIRAKVPAGDWLYPVFNLRATKDFHNPSYDSGVLRIASVKGNQLLQCGGEEVGSKRVASGLLVTRAGSVKSILVNVTNDHSWSDDFHTFTFTWTPDELFFSVDDGEREKILPEGQSLKDAFGHGAESQEKALLDQEFYLSVGLSVGGAVEFPDDCVGSDTETECSPGTKPWKNFEVKSLLKFWQKKSCWLQTWKDPVLIVDYVSVRAL